MFNFEEFEFYPWEVITTFYGGKWHKKVTGVVQREMRLQNTQLRNCADTD